jgi:hypothetical protein
VTTVGIYSPGAMGSTLAYSCSLYGHRTIWASEGRSDKTKARALKFGIEDVLTLDSLLEQSDFLFVIANNFDPFGFAEAVVSKGFSGIYVDFNSMNEDIDDTDLENTLVPNGVKYVEGSLRGWPIAEPSEENLGEKTMYLSGSHADKVKELFGGFWRIRTMPKSAKMLNRVLAEELSIIYGQG